MRIFMVLLSLLGFGMEMFLILMMLFRLLALRLLQLMLSVLWSWLVCCWCCCHCCANYHFKNLLIVLNNLIVLYVTSLILFVESACHQPDRFDQHFQACVHFPLTSAVDKSQKHKNKFLGNAENQTLFGDKQECYLCAMQPPYKSNSLMDIFQNSLNENKTKIQ